LMDSPRINSCMILVFPTPYPPTTSRPCLVRVVVSSSRWIETEVGDETIISSLADRAKYLVVKSKSFQAHISNVEGWKV
jgi:hypothetical protein